GGHLLETIAAADRGVPRYGQPTVNTGQGNVTVHLKIGGIRRRGNIKSIKPRAGGAGTVNINCPLGRCSAHVANATSVAEIETELVVNAVGGECGQRPKQAKEERSENDPYRIRQGGFRHII